MLLSLTILIVPRFYSKNITAADAGDRAPERRGFIAPSDAAAGEEGKIVHEVAFCGAYSASASAQVAVEGGALLRASGAAGAAAAAPAGGIPRGPSITPETVFDMLKRAGFTSVRASEAVALARLMQHFDRFATLEELAEQASAGVREYAGSIAGMPQSFALVDREVLAPSGTIKHFPPSTTPTSIGLSIAAKEAAKQGDRAIVVDSLLELIKEIGVPPVLPFGRKVPTTATSYRATNDTDVRIDLNTINIFVFRLFLKGWSLIAQVHIADAGERAEIIESVKLLSQNLRTFDISLLISAHEAREIISQIITEASRYTAFSKIFSGEDIDPSDFREICTFLEELISRTDAPERLLCICVVYNLVGHILRSNYRMPVIFHQALMAKYLRALIRIKWAPENLELILRVNRL